MDPLPGPPKYMRHDRTMRKRRHSDADTASGDSMYYSFIWKQLDYIYRMA